MLPTPTDFHGGGRFPMDINEQTVVEEVFKNSENDYATVLAIAKRARQILDDYPKYEDELEHKKATIIALDEYVGHDFSFEVVPRPAANDE
jgi:DNA-directed RNA polymerase subunit K/omega